MAVSQAEKLRIWERGESGLREGLQEGHPGLVLQRAEHGAQGLSLRHCSEGTGTPVLLRELPGLFQGPLEMCLSPGLSG